MSKSQRKFKWGATLFLLALISACAASDFRGPLDYSDIKDDEHVVFFRTSAWLDETTNHWNIPIHGWIYEPEDSTVRKGMLSQVLKLKYGLEAETPEAEKIFSRRVNLLFADNERRKVIIVRIGGSNHRLSKSEPNGHFKSVLKLPAQVIGEISKNNILSFSAVTQPGERRKFAGQVKLVPPTGLSIISDIDDTVKISNVLDHKVLFDNTFFKPFKAAPGMSQTYQHWSKSNVSFHMVSSSPWHLYTPLKEFMDKDGFPWATFSLKMVRVKDESILNLFKKGTETKPLQIEPILNRYPQRKFVLIGDSGEQDPEVYADLIKKYPGQVVSIFIRNVTDATPDNERFTKVFTGIDKGKWQLFRGPSALRIKLDNYLKKNGATERN